jgi:hypothetical protein
MALPLWAIHENVVGFATAIIDDALEQFYFIWHIRVQPRDIGFGLIRRVRVYTILVRRGRLKVLLDLQQAYELVKAEVGGAICTIIPDCFLATPEQLLVEENRARSRRKLSHVTSCSGSWLFLLTTKQRQYCEEYSSKWLASHRQVAHEDPSCVFDLTQNPLKRKCQTSRDGSLPTLRHAGSLIWVPFLGRWLLPCELAAASGFPVTTQLAQAALVERDNASDYTAQMLGNGMHVFSVAVMMALVLACTQPVNGKA